MLDETYKRMLVGIDTHCQERAQRILTLLCFSSRPLSVIEIIEAIAVDIQDLQPMTVIGDWKTLRIFSESVPG